MELRRYKAEQPGEFRRIKALPVRTRTGRASKTKSGGTVAFIRNRRLPDAPQADLTPDIIISESFKKTHLCQWAKRQKRFARRYCAFQRHFISPNFRNSVRK